MFARVPLIMYTAAAGAAALATSKYKILRAYFFLSVVFLFCEKKMYIFDHQSNNQSSLY